MLINIFYENQYYFFNSLRLIKKWIIANKIYIPSITFLINTEAWNIFNIRFNIANGTRNPRSVKPKLSPKPQATIRL